MKDYLEQELNVGDNVVYISHTKSHSWLTAGVIQTIHNKQVTMTDGARRSPDKVVKIGG